MTALATLADLRARMELTVDDARAQAALDDASAAVRAYTGQTFDVATTTERCRLRSGGVRLAQRPVTAVAAVQSLAGVALAFYWDGAERVYLWAWPCGGPLLPANGPYVPERMADLVDVTYTHGYEAVPGEIVAVVCNMAARALGSAPEQGNLTGATLDGYGETYGATGAAGAVGLFSDERALLDRYRRVGAQAVLW